MSQCISTVNPLTVFNRSRNFFYCTSVHYHSFLYNFHKPGSRKSWCNTFILDLFLYISASVWRWSSHSMEVILPKPLKRLYLHGVWRLIARHTVCHGCQSNCIEEHVTVSKLKPQNNLCEDWGNTNPLELHLWTGEWGDTAHSSLALISNSRSASSAELLPKSSSIKKLDYTLRIFLDVIMFPLFSFRNW